MSADIITQNKIKFAVSGRSIWPQDDLLAKLEAHYPGVPISEVFAFTQDFSRLYGGREFYHFLSYEQLEAIYSQGWTFSLPLSNLFYSNDAYKETIPILEKIYRPGNSVILSSKTLAIRIRKDFPEFKIKASCIANIGYNPETVLQELDEAFQYYDFVTLHQKMWNNENILTQIKNKDRIVLFADVSCAPHCKNQACYWNASVKNFFRSDNIIGQPYPLKTCILLKKTKNNKEIVKKCWKTINFNEPLHPMYDGYTHFKYGKKRNISKIKALLKSQGHPGY